MEALQALQAIATLERIENIPRRRKMYREKCNPFSLPDEDFQRRYRFNKRTAAFVIDLVREELQLDRRGCGTPPELQVLTAIRCWGRREVQDDGGDLHGLSQATVSRICARVARAIARHSATFIKMPQSITEQERVAREFSEIRNFPSVVGCIDCTHIKIKKPGGDSAQYYINRKGYYSLNVQVTCDAKLSIMDIVARWRGSTHDSRIFNESTLKERFERGEFRGRLLGDSGYRLEPYLFTPILRPQNINEERYNRAHISTRNCVERCFGVWKQRFQCLLYGLTVQMHNIKPTIIALAVLHNIAIQQEDTVPDACLNVGIPVGHRTSKASPCLTCHQNVHVTITHCCPCRPPQTSCRTSVPTLRFPPHSYNQQILYTHAPIQYEADIRILHDTVRALRLSGWYYEQPLDWQSAKDLLKDASVGAFLLRNSADKNFLFSLSVQTEKGPTSVRLHYDCGYFRLDCDKSLAEYMPRFRGVVDLIQHYCREGTKGSNRSTVWVDLEGCPHSQILLKQPVMKQPSRLQHIARLAIHKALDSNPLKPRLWNAPKYRQLPLPNSLLQYLDEYPYSV